ncbi:MAG: methyl-coenzyme M reductase family protein [Methanobacteriaceae archaeon]|nr:methyl-coenzyme M reductase family protein [Methanobacteriaceae archaeon]
MWLINAQEDYMYQIRIYSGGLYKFNEFVEFIDDLGGLVLKRDKFHISRGEYFLSEELHALTVIPTQESENAEIKAKNLKGSLNLLDVEEDNRIKILSCLTLHDLLSKNIDGLNKEQIINEIKCPCISEICIENEECLLNYLDEVLDGMLQMEMIEEHVIEQVTVYKIFNH